ncbi:hypothetical protein SK128_019260, partial [Halocaridina rubra]
PNRPEDVTILVKSGKMAQVSLDPPLTGGYSAFRLKVIPISEPQNSIRNLLITESQLPFVLKELTPGASYELQLYTVYENKESDAYFSSNFTTQTLPGPMSETLPSPLIETLPRPLFEALSCPVFETLPRPMFETLPSPMFETLPRPMFETLPCPMFETASPVGTA